MKQLFLLQTFFIMTFAFILAFSLFNLGAQATISKKENVQQMNHFSFDKARTHYILAQAASVNRNKKLSMKNEKKFSVINLNVGKILFGKWYDSIVAS